MKKSLLLVSIVLMLALLATGCTADQGTATKVPAATATVTPTASPLASPSLLPTQSPEISQSPSAEPSLSPAATEGLTAPAYDTDTLQTEVEKLSEVSRATVAAMDGKALVGITFDPAYQGTLTDRIVEMVGQQITGKEKGITEVAVTADPEQISQIESLSKSDAPDEEKFNTLFEKIRPAGSGATQK